MKITSEIYNIILNNIPSSPPETGGILGGKSGIITKFVFDDGLPESDRGHYYPDIEKLNHCILEWLKCGIEFYGIVHSHFTNERGLSLGDEAYIQKIMGAMPVNIEILYFPIIFPRKEIVSYRAEREEDEIKINFDFIKILF